MSIRLSQVDDLSRRDHSHLRETDTCFFLREYTRGVGWRGSETNDLIDNFKKSPEKYRAVPKVWKWKLRAIEQISAELSAALNHEWLKIATLVPIPSSKTSLHPDYDDRMLSLLNGIARQAHVKADIRELIVQTEDTEAFHSRDDRRDPVEIESRYMVDEGATNPTPKVIGLFDDLLTTGAHFRAAHSLFAKRFPGVPIVGIFVARRVIPEAEAELSW